MGYLLPGNTCMGFGNKCVIAYSSRCAPKIIGGTPERLKQSTCQVSRGLRCWGRQGRLLGGSPGFVGCKAGDDEGPREVEVEVEVEKGEVKNVEQDEEPEDSYVKSLKSLGMDKGAATKILKTWKETGSDNPDALRRLFLTGTLRPLGVLLLQALLDLGAVAGALSAANAFRLMDEFPLQIGVEIVCYFVGFYFLSNLFFDLTTLGVLVYSGVKFGTNAEAFLEAVEKIAGEYSVLGKAKTTVDVIKVVQALNSIADILQDETDVDGEDSASTLSNLSAYLVLVRAKEDFGFDPTAYNLSEKAATRIASKFCEYDLNDDGVLEVNELSSLCTALGQELTDDEVNAAMKIIDTDSSGVIEFDEFVEWWVNKVNPEKVSS